MSSQTNKVDEYDNRPSSDIDYDLDNAVTDPANEPNVHQNKKGGQKKNIWVRLGLSRRRRYFLAALFNLIIIWAGAIAFVLLTPDSYVSKFTLIIPGAGAGSSLNLDDLGQATTSVNSAYASAKVDPKTNYKAIATSPVVISKAAESLGLNKDEFGKPKIKLIDQTTLLEVSVTANESVAALDKSTEFLNALESTLADLRSKELHTRRKANETVLSIYRENVDKAQSAVLAFQRESAIVSPQQFEDLVLNVESIKQRRADAQVRFQSIKTKLEDLQNLLDIDPQQASKALKLQNDTVFGSLREQVAEYSGELIEKQAVWGRNHPKVVHAQSRYSYSKQALLDRARLIADIDSHATLDTLNLSGNSARGQFFQTIISLTADKASARSEIDSYLTQLTELEGRMDQNAVLAATLQDLERTHQVATAIYVSAAAKTDLGNSDIFASYPMTQILMAPTLPNGPEKFTKPVALAGALIASVLICLALLISWKRYVLLQKARKKS